MSSRSTKSSSSCCTAQVACSRKPMTVTGIWPASSSRGSRNACPSALATTSPASRPDSARFSMCSSMSASTSESSVDLGLAKTAKPTLRSASTHGRTFSEEPWAMLVNTVASASSCSSSPRERSAVCASSQRPSASKRGRKAAVGRPPRIEPSPMSRFGASHTSSTMPVSSAAVVAACPSRGVMSLRPRFSRWRRRPSRPPGVATRIR